MRNLYLLPCLLFASLTAFTQSITVVNLTCEHQVNPTGIDESAPRLSWQLQSEGQNIRQTAYQVRVAEKVENLDRKRRQVWDSGEVASNQSVLVPYDGPALKPGRLYVWQVRVWDNQGHVSEWSEPATWKQGIGIKDWQADWITVPWKENKDVSQPAPMLRTDFFVDGRIERATVYITSRGLYEAHLNGQRVGNQVFTPGWTSYNKRLQYQTYDVTDQIQEGPNAVGVQLGDGWYRGSIGWVSQRNRYGEDLALLMQIDIEYRDGVHQLIVSDGSWTAAKGPVRTSDIYHGERYDARREHPGWSRVGFDASEWARVKKADFSKDNIVAPDGPPVRKIEEIQPVQIFTTPNGDQVVDFGQNMVGWVRMQLSGPAGQEVTLQHAEVLDKEGNFYTENLRSADAQLSYTLKGDSVETYEPHFTFMGFRYVKVENWPGELTPESLTGVVIHSDMEPTGSFHCSNPLLNQLQHNIRWGQKGNFLDVPTDCPQRDERMGWTGDAQAFASTAAFNYDVAAFFRKWLQDVAADQREDGAVPHVVPHVLGRNAYASAGWADAATIIPWQMYLAYGDPLFLEQQYESMKAWVGYMEEQAGDELLWNEGAHFGDWLFYSVNDDRSGESAITDKYLIAQAFFINSVDIMRRSAKVLDKPDDVDYYTGLHQKLKETFLREYVTPGGRLISSTQTAYVLALQFDLLPEDQRQQAADRLVDNIRRYGHITTGFLGTPYICHVLSRYGYLDVAYELLNRTEYPSWLYPVTMGATTIWERWDGIKPDSTFQNASMNSFNHYAYGAIGDWMYKTVAGLDLDEQHPGYKHVLIHPRPGGGLTEARATHEGPYGTIVSGWQLDGDQLNMEVTIPPNSIATLRIPNAEVDGVQVNGEPLQTSNGILVSKQDGSDVVIEVGSGKYTLKIIN